MAMPTTTMRKISFLWLPLLVLLLGSSRVRGDDVVEAPSCEEDNAKEADPTTLSCGIYWWDEYIVAGRWYQPNEVIGFPRDTVHHFRQQSRRGFPAFHRYYYLFGHLNRSKDDELSQMYPKQHDGQGPLLTFAPGTEYPFTCHSSLYNARINTTTFEIRADRAIAPLEPIFLECFKRQDHEDLEIDDLPEINRTTLEEKDHCFDWSIDMPATGGVFAKRPMARDDLITFGKLLHLHRSELYDEATQSYDRLVQYTYGHPQSDLLLLPLFPIVSRIRHGRPANVELAMNSAKETIELVFSEHSQINFGDRETPFLDALVAPLRDIAVGEELLLDYGDVFEEALQKSNNRNALPLQERMGLFPDEWLQNETRKLASEMPQFDTTPLKPYEIQRVRHQNGYEIAEHLHRVGLPDSVADTMEQWAQDIGLMDQLKRYVTDRALEPDEQERVRINNGTWWVKRFSSEWQSNLHYMATDDDESTEQFFHALHRGGFDQVLAAIGNHFGLKTLTCYYTTYIVVSHCVRSHIHSDSDSENVFNFIFPVLQYDDGQPELDLAESDAVTNRTHYVYERNAGVLLGMDGMHGTAPTDYRDSGGVRVVVSVYMGDFSADDDEVEEYIEDWEDPPYPTYHEGQLHHALVKRVHWAKDDPSVSIGNPMPRAFPLRPPTKEQKRQKYLEKLNERKREKALESLKQKELEKLNATKDA